MEQARILQSFRPPQESFQGLAWVKGTIWVASARAGRLFEQTAVAVGAYETHRDLASPVQNPGGMAWDGEKFLVADRLAKVVFRVHPDTGVAEPVLDLLELRQGEGPEVFRAPSSQVSDLAWGHGHLWVACQAGYSSSVYRIDIDAKQVIQHFWAPGPKPVGLSFDSQEEFLWTADASNREFREFTSQGEWTEAQVASPVARPYGLALDDEDSFWTSDEETGQICQIKREG